MGDWWDKPVGTQVASEATVAPSGEPSDSDELVNVVFPNGTAGTVKRSELEDAIISKGAKLESDAAAESRGERKAQEGRAGQTFIERFAGASTFGGSDLLARALNADEARKMGVRREVNAGAALAGDVVGSFAPGAGSLAGMAGHALEEGAGRLLGGGLLGRVGAKTAAGVGEGVLFGTGAGISQVALSPDPITWEGAAATIGTNALAGAAVGGLFGTAGGLLGEGARAAKSFANKQVERLSAREGTTVAEDAAVDADIPAMDQRAAGKALAAENEAIKARKAESIARTDAEIQGEEDFLKAQQQESSKKLWKSAKEYKKFNEQNFIPSKGEEAATLAGSARKIRKGTNNRTGFVESNGRKGSFQTGLQEQETALENILSKKDKLLADAEKQTQDLLDSLPQAPEKANGYLAHGESPRLEDHLPSYRDLGPEDTHVVQASANELADRGLFELPGAGVDEGRMARVRADLGKPEQWDQPIRLSVDKEGRFFVEDGRHRLRAALEEGGERPLEIHISRGAGDVTSEGTVQLGARPSMQAPEAIAAGERVTLTPEQSVLYRDFAGMKQIVKGEPKAMSITGEELAAFRAGIEQGMVKPLPLMRIERAEKVLEANRALQQEFRAAQAELDSPKLRELKTLREQVKADTTPTPRAEKIKAHLEDLKTPSLGRTIAQGAGGALGGSLGAAAGPIGSITGAFIGRDVANTLFDRFVRKIVSSNNARMKSITSTIATMFEKGARASSKALPHATKIVSAFHYANPKDVDAVLGPNDTRKSKSQLVNDFRARARELDSVTERAGPSAVFQARMKALEGLHDRLAAIWAIAPEVANGIEKLQAAKWEFLATKMPRNPAPPYLQVGPDTWEPDHAQIAKFARYMEAAEHPEKVVERVADGTVTPEDVETLKTLYPSHYEEVRRQCMDHASTMRRTLPYVQRLNLSILLDVPVDPALTPEAMSVYQAPKPDPSTQQQAKPAPIKPMPMGTVEPTAAQHASAP